MLRISGSDTAIIDAVRLGYTADREGNIYNPDGKLLKCAVKKHGHLSVTFKMRYNGRKRPVLAHRFIMYYFLGDELFKHECVRHLNDIPCDNRIENLALGSMADNRADIPFEKLSAIAKANAHLLVERSRKLKDEDILLLRELYANTDKSYATLAEEFGISTMTAYRAINKQSWGDV